MGEEQFFTRQTDQSYVKAKIVSEYFDAWTRAIIPNARRMSGKIAYVDLFAGPGRYKDGAQSTPLLILTKAIERLDVRDMLITIFNDIDVKNIKILEEEIQKLEGIDTLRYPPKIYNREVDASIIEIFEKSKFIPTFFFIDPWGYKGLSLKLLSSALKNWGCDCIFFFNYKRINAGIHNDKVDEHMRELFGDQRAARLRCKLKHLSPYQREFAIIEEFAEALKEMGGQYVLPFRFKNDNRSRTTHYLIFTSKDFLGYDIMKYIMARASSRLVQGIATFEYCNTDFIQPTLIEAAQPLDELQNMLLRQFAKKRISINQIYENHSVGKPYRKKNYKDAFRNLETQGKIVADTPPEKRRRHKGEVTIGDDLMFTFPLL